MYSHLKDEQTFKHASRMDAAIQQITEQSRSMEMKNEINSQSIVWSMQGIIMNN